MREVAVSGDWIKLGQFLKLADLVSSGAEAKIIISEGCVKVNGEVCLMRGKKLTPGDIVESEGLEPVKVTAEESNWNQTV